VEISEQRGVPFRFVGAVAGPTLDREVGLVEAKRRVRLGDSARSDREHEDGRPADRAGDSTRISTPTNSTVSASDMADTKSPSGHDSSRSMGSSPVPSSSIKRAAASVATVRSSGPLTSTVLRSSSRSARLPVPGAGS
jgi:hypothetical protein